MICKETRCWDKEWVGICPLTRYSAAKCISFIITFSTLLIEKRDDDTQILFQKMLWTYWLVRNICVAKWDILLLKGWCLVALVPTQIQGKRMGIKICPPPNSLRYGTVVLRTYYYRHVVREYSCCMMFWKHLCFPQGNACLPFLWSMGKKTLVVKANGEFPMSNIHPVFVPSAATEVMCSWESYWCTRERQGEFSTFKILWLQKNLTLRALLPS